MQEELRQGDAMAALRRFNDLLESLPEDRWGEPCQSAMPAWRFAGMDGAEQQRPRLVTGHHGCTASAAVCCRHSCGQACTMSGQEVCLKVGQL